MIEEAVHAALDYVLPGGVWPDTVPAQAAPPYCVYQQVGGAASQTLCGPGRKNMRLQVWAWARTRSEASATMRAAADALSAELGAVHVGELVAQYDDTVNLYGAQQDFSIWYHE